MKSSRGFGSLGLILAIIIGLAVLGGVVYYGKEQRPAAQLVGNGNVSTTASVTGTNKKEDTQVVQNSGSSQLQKDLAVETPRIVSEDENKSLSPDLKKIKTEVIPILAAYRSDTSIDPADLSLRAIGKRYVLVEMTNVEAAWDIIVDSKSQTVAGGPDDIANAPDFGYGNHGFVYIYSSSISLYQIDSSSSAELPQSNLSGTETYYASDGLGASATETHTDHTLTVSVFDDAQRDPANPYLARKIREVTYTLP